MKHQSYDELNNKLRYQLYNQMWVSRIDSLLFHKLWAGLKGELFNQLHNQLFENINDQLHEDLR